MRKSWLVGLAAAVLAVFAFPAIATAQNPHVVGQPSASLQNNNLVVSASVAGLGNVPAVDLNLSGTVNVFSRCYNRGGNRPQADNKQETINVNATETFPVRNGRTNATFTIPVVSTLTCPGNQRVVIESTSWDLTLTYQGNVLATFQSS